MKLPIERIPGTTPPQFKYYQTVQGMDGEHHAVEFVGYVPVSMEPALCDLLRIVEQFAVENEELRSK